MKRLSMLVSLTMVLSLAGGCRSFINVFDTRDPIRMAIVTDNVLDVVNPFSAWDPLLDEMGAALGRPVVFDCPFPSQAGPQLQTGRFALAAVTPYQFVHMPGHEALRVIAAPSSDAQAASRPAVLLVQADSPAQAIADLRGASIAFGPPGATRTYHAALALLAEHDLAEEDLKFDILGPGKHHRNARLRMQLVMEGRAAAAFVDQADWEALPAAEPEDNEPSQARLRVLAQTIPVPQRMIVASPKTDMALVNDTQAFLLRAHQSNPEALQPLGYAAFWAVPPDHVAGFEKLRNDVTPQDPFLP
jgi:ABC-type phosphate/phosphonate transport system substrate-binding protein